MKLSDWTGALIVAAALGTAIGTAAAPEPQRAIALAPNGQAVLLSDGDDIDEERFEALETAVSLLLRRAHLGESYFQNVDPAFAEELRTPLEVLADITDTEEAVALDEATYQLLDQTLIDEWNNAQGN